MMWYWGYPSHMGFFGGILSVLLWVLVIFVVVSLVRSSRYGRCGWRWNGRNFGQTDSKTPLDILKERYAKGEINEEQLAKMKKELEK